MPRAKVFGDAEIKRFMVHAPAELVAMIDRDVLAEKVRAAGPFESSRSQFVVEKLAKLYRFKLPRAEAK